MEDWKVCLISPAQTRRILLGDGVTDVTGFKFGREDEGVGEEGVAEEDGDFWAVVLEDGGGVVADGGFVEDVVVDEGGEVREFDDAGDFDEVMRDWLVIFPGGVEDEHRADAFAFMLEGVADEVLEFWLEGGDLGMKEVG